MSGDGRRVLVAGFATRHVVQSAYRAGYLPYAVDHFCDQDLSWYTEDRIRFDDLTELPSCIQVMCERHPIDLMVVTSGAEQVTSCVPLLGTSSNTIDRMLDKLETGQFFKEYGISTPPPVEEGDYPAMLKPRRGAGGWRNRIIRNAAERDAWVAEFENTPYLLQNVVQGIPASVSCLSDGHRAVAIATNEQILRDSKEAPYGFSGSVTPFTHSLNHLMVRFAERTAAACGCIGSIGIDFVMGDTPWAIEINPRFQATVDTIEMAYDCNMFQFHLNACRGILPTVPLSVKGYAVRKILFADKDMTLSCDLRRFHPTVADIPWPGSFFEEGEAIVSVFGTGRTREDALDLLNTNITSIRRYIHQ